MSRTMPEYIDKSALYSKIADLEKEAMKKYLDFSISNPSIAAAWEQILNERTSLKHLVADSLAYDVEPVKHGKWHHHPSGSVICSCCGDWELWPDEDTVKHWHYCPNCGAKMEEE